MDDTPAAINRKRIWLISSLLSKMVNRQLITSFQEIDFEDID
jgi:hypothetical protein